jgi:hypothetical protein
LRTLGENCPLISFPGEWGHIQTSLQSLCGIERSQSEVKELVNNPKIKSLLVFPSSGKPEETSASSQETIRVTRYS